MFDGAKIGAFRPIYLDERNDYKKMIKKLESDVEDNDDVDEDDDVKTNTRLVRGKRYALQLDVG